MFKKICLTAATAGLLLGCAPTSTDTDVKSAAHSKSERVMPSSGLKEVAPDIYSFSPSGDYYSMIIVSDAGVAVIESVSSDHSTQLVEAIRGITDQPIKYGFHSHNHWDHASGGQVLKDAGAQIIMHKRAAEWFEAHPGQDTAPPDIVWSGDQRTFTLGDKTIELNYLGLNHGLGMTVFRIPERDMAYMADIVTPNRLLFSIVPDFNIPEWERTLKEVLTMDFSSAVCSHNELPGDAAFTCSKVHVQEHLDFMSDLRNAIFAEFQKGTPGMEVPAAIELPKYKDWAYYDEYLEMNAYRIMLDLWMGPFPWIPEGR